MLNQVSLNQKNTPVQFSQKQFSHFLKFWIFILIVSGVGVWMLVPDRNSSAHSEPVSLNSVSNELPPFLPPRIAEIIPATETTDVLLGIEDPLVVRFAESVKSYYIRFELEPQVELLYENNPEKTEFRLLPKEPLRDGTRYTLKVSSILRETPDAAYRVLAETNFTTLSVPVAEKNTVETVVPETVARLTTGKYIDVNIARQTMTLFQDGRAVKSYPVSSGKPGMDTPKGEFSIHNKAPRPWSKTYGLYMPNWMAFTTDGKFGIHELPEWPGGYKEGANHLGRPVSHGCIRLGVGSAREVYEWTDVGTSIIVH